MRSWSFTNELYYLTFIDDRLSYIEYMNIHSELHKIIKYSIVQYKLNII